MNKLCCELNPVYYCGECSVRECISCWIASSTSHFKFSERGGIRVECIYTGKELISGKTFDYYG